MRSICGWVVLLILGVPGVLMRRCLVIVGLATRVSLEVGNNLLILYHFDAMAVVTRRRTGVNAELLWRTWGHALLALAGHGGVLGERSI